jgi:CRP/FNR family transcriptional regulator, cyclic AMP receptor protein
VTKPAPDNLCRDVPIFAGLNPSECRQLADIATVQPFVPGEILVEQGGMSRTFWILLEGTCEVIRQVDETRPRDEAIVLAVLAPFTHFGEMSFFRPAPHSASVRAQTRGQAMRIERVDYDDLIRDGVWGAYKLAYNVTQTLADRLRRMDEWISELMAHRPPAECEPEWNKFRERLFGEWNL